jgi:hypothetical protein
MMYVLLLMLEATSFNTLEPCRFSPIPSEPTPEDTVWSVPMPTNRPDACVGEFIALDGTSVRTRVVGGRLQSDPAVGYANEWSECDLTPVAHLVPGAYRLRVSVPGQPEIGEWPVVITSQQVETRPRWSDVPRMLGLQTRSVWFPGEILGEDMIVVELGVEDAAAVRTTAVDLESGRRLSGTHRVHNGQITMGYRCQGVHMVEGRPYAVTFSAVDAAGRETPAPGPPLRIEKPDTRRWSPSMFGNLPASRPDRWLAWVACGAATALLVAASLLLLWRRARRL